MSMRPEDRLPRHGGNTSLSVHNLKIMQAMCIKCAPLLSADNCEYFRSANFRFFFTFFQVLTTAAAQQLCTLSQFAAAFQYVNNVQKMFIVFLPFAMVGTLGSTVAKHQELQFITTTKKRGKS
jgi:hypothetical protein